MKGITLTTIFQIAWPVWWLPKFQVYREPDMVKDGPVIHNLFTIYGGWILFGFKVSLWHDTKKVLVHKKES